MTESPEPSPKAGLFGKLAVARGLITDAQLEYALAQQAKLDEAGHHRLLGEIMVTSGVMASEDVAQLLSLQSKRILRCPECFALFNARQYDPKRLYRCRRCREYLEPMIDPPPTDSKGALGEVEAGEGDEQKELQGRAILVVKTGSKAGTMLRLAEGETVRVGTQDDLELTLKDPGVSAVHAKFRSSGLDVLIFDYGGEGGTFVNGKPIDFLSLVAGDEIRIGEVVLKARYWDAGADKPKDGATVTQAQGGGNLRKDALFGHELIEAGLANADQINQVLAEQDRRRKAGKKARIGELMVELGFLTNAQVMSVLKKQKKHVLFCPQCKTPYNINLRDLGKNFKCASCNALVEVPATEEALQEFDPAVKARIKLDTTRRKKIAKAFRKKPQLGSQSRPRPKRKAKAKPPLPALKPEPNEIELAADLEVTLGTGETTELDPSRVTSDEIPQLVPEDIDPDATLDIPPPPRPSQATAKVNRPGDESDAPFGELAVQLRYVTRDQLSRTLKQQKELREQGSYAPQIGELLVENCYITPAQRQEILKRQGKRTSPIDIPGYHLLGKLGEGSTGSVFRAVMLKGRRPVALKIVRPDLCKDERFVRRFYREAETAMRLSHPNVVGGVDAGQHGQYLYMAMEFVEGETVQAYLEREGRMSERYSIDISYQISLALEYAGENDLIHRDVKPENILLARDGTAKLIDLGLAKLISDNLGDGQIVGTPNYISPEQAKGEPGIDIRSDMYSLGASIYHMVTGQVPFHHASPMETMLMHIRDHATPPNQRTDEISDEYSRLIMRMLEKKPSDRHQCWAELTQAFESLLAA